MPIPIKYGARLIGNMGKNNIALIHVRTGEEEALSPETFTVARYRRDFWKESSIGVLYTLRSTKDEAYTGPIGAGQEYDRGRPYA